MMSGVAPASKDQPRFDVKRGIRRQLYQTQILRGMQVAKQPLHRLQPISKPCCGYAKEKKNGAALFGQPLLACASCLRDGEIGIVVLNQTIP